MLTLLEVMNMNPGISMPDAVLLLNAYNSAVARGEEPPSISGIVGSEGLAASKNLTPGAASAIAAVSSMGMSAAGTVMGEGGATTKPHREMYAC